jgi:hypothetical protein
MPGMVFVSCGQATEAERKIANKIKDWFTSKNYTTYVAIQTQSIQDVNSSIIQNLKTADYYVFIDLRREKIDFFHRRYRGSLFTNQELAIAYSLEFDEAIFLQQSCILLEGIGKYILSNAKRFDRLDEILNIIKQEVTKRNWSPTYSRHLVPLPINKPTQAFFYRDLTRTANQYIWHIQIQNRRKDLGAFLTVANLESIELPSKQVISPDTTYLKWANQTNYERTILPQSTVKFDAFAIDDSPPHTNVYLHSATDFFPRQPIIQGQPGTYTLNYQVFAQGFPLLKFAVVLNLTGNIATTIAQIV